MKSWHWSLLLLCFVHTVSADFTPLNLDPWQQKSSNHAAEWLLPQGEFRSRSVPFNVNGFCVLRMRSVKSINSPGDLAVNQSPDFIHLFASTEWRSSDNTEIFSLLFKYEDASTAEMKITYGEQMRSLFEPRFSDNPPPSDPQTAITWRSENSEAAATDCRLRLFHSIVRNPLPRKILKSLSWRPSHEYMNVLVAGVTLEKSGRTENLAIVEKEVSNPPPDPSTVEGIVTGSDGRRLSNCLVRVVAARLPGTDEENIFVDDPLVGFETKTDAEGRFEITRVKEQRLYQLLFVEDDLPLSIFPGAIGGSKIPVRLLGEDPSAIPLLRVLDENGQPIMGAVAHPEGLGKGRGGKHYGNQGTKAISDKHGVLMVKTNEGYSSICFKITAPGFAPIKEWYPYSNFISPVSLGRGATVTGRIIKNGIALSNVTVGINGRDGEAGVYLGKYKTRTDHEGRFTLKNLTPNSQWHFFGTVASLKPDSIKVRQIQTGDHQQTNDLGEIEVTRGFTLAGQVKSRYGTPLPKGLKVLVQLDHSYENLSDLADLEGHFKIEGIPSSSIEIDINRRPWKLSPANRSYSDSRLPALIQGALLKDKLDLVLLVEQGPEPIYNTPSQNGWLPQGDEISSHPISGFENPEQMVAWRGKVVEAKTGKQVRNFVITPGHLPPGAQKGRASKTLVQRLASTIKAQEVPWDERPYWHYVRRENFTNGAFEVFFPDLSGTPTLLVEAEGYDPVILPAMRTGTNGLVVSLEKGVGPSGMIVDEKGKPVSGASVFYAVKDEQCGLETNGELNIYGGEEVKRLALKVTGTDGRFSFAKRPEGISLMVTHSNGWVSAELRDLTDDEKLVLKPWSSVKGTLVDKTGAPVPNASLSFRPKTRERAAFFHAREESVTDAQGRFEFGKVPPMLLVLNRMQPASANSWSVTAQTYFEPKPGETNDLGKVVLDTPPPPTLIEELKKKVGL